MFDPARHRESLQTFYLQYNRDIRFEDAEMANSLTGHGNALAQAGTLCLLVGYFAEGRELLQKAKDFLGAAIDKSEVPRQYGHGVTEAIRLHNYSLCAWLLDGRQNSSQMTECVRWLELWFDETDAWHNRVEIQLSMPDYLDSGELETLITRYERAGLKAPKSLRKIKEPGTMAYIIARHRLGLAYSEKEVTASLQSFLNRFIPEEVFSHYLSVVLWMKIAHWTYDDDPVAALLRCYDYLPSVERPKYP